MALRFVIGRSGAGKTHYCLDRIRQKVLEQPDGAPIVMLVPEQEPSNGVCITGTNL